MNIAIVYIKSISDFNRLILDLPVKVRYPSFPPYWRKQPGECTENLGNLVEIRENPEKILVLIKLLDL